MQLPNDAQTELKLEVTAAMRQAQLSVMPALELGLGDGGPGDATEQGGGGSGAPVGSGVLGLGSVGGGSASDRLHLADSGPVGGPR